MTSRPVSPVTGTARARHRTPDVCRVQRIRLGGWWQQRGRLWEVHAADCFPL